MYSFIDSASCACMYGCGCGCVWVCGCVCFFPLSPPSHRQRQPCCSCIRSHAQHQHLRQCSRGSVGCNSALKHNNDAAFFVIIFAKLMSASVVSVLQNPPVDEAALARCIHYQPRNATQLLVHSCHQRSRRCARSSGLREKSRPHHGGARPRALVQVSAAAAALHRGGSGSNIAE